ncbi:hypothetical protein ACGFNY_04940 [Streptomyces chartreusis]|uniref:hypothetical protein n=1 Tax=Streptomyces chartreusis TaxID=1969 RepID=UPI0037145AD3
MTTNPQTDPIRKDLLPCTPPPEWEFHTVYGARTGTDGCALFPGDAGPVVIRRRVTYGDWEPVRPDCWADEPEPAAPAAGRVVSAAPTQTDEARRERYAVAIHDAMEADLSLVDQEPAVQALFARAAEAAVALADAELAARRAADLRDAEEICDEAGASYTAKALNEQADGAYELMARFRRKAEEAERTAAAVPAVPVPPTAHADRAAVLLEAADWLKVWRPEFFERWAVAEQDRYEDGVDDAAAELRRLAAEAQQQPDTETCAECGHPKGAHREGEDPVTPGICGVCEASNPDDAHHDYKAGVRRG